MTEHQKEALKEVPEMVVNPSTRQKYVKGKFLGKGGFARCYELTEVESRRIYAGKIVSKTLLVKKHQKDKMTQEIAIHRSLSHGHVVNLHGFFEDNENVYILLELCRRRSMMELHKRRKAITEPEARYFVKQVVDACIYLHDTMVIHRDLKLGNLFLNDEMMVKIGDFGLATKLDFQGERKKTLCGTPNYIAPEMLGKKGHSFEVDIWAIGCILYTLLVGKPPFETSSLKETYVKIKKNEYHIPSRVSPAAGHLIRRLLAADPSQRPTIHEILGFEFFTDGYTPTRLPTSCLTMAPKFQSTSSSQLLPPASSKVRLPSQRPPLIETGNAAPTRIGGGVADVQMLSPRNQARKDILAAPVRSLNTVPEDRLAQPPATEPFSAAAGVKVDTDMPSDYYLSDLYRQLTTVLHSRPFERTKVQEDEAEDPAATPVFWVGKWVDYSDKYGLGYQLSDNSVGVLFNDSTKVVLDNAGEQIQYIDKENREYYYTVHGYAEELSKKVTLLKYFQSYMNEHLLKAGEHMAPKDGDELARLPCLKAWFRTRSAIVMHLTNGTLQINFFQDHTKVILCPLMQAVTYIDGDKQFRTFRFTLIETFGCSKDLCSRLRYARTMVERLLTNSSSSRPGALSTVRSASASTAGGSGSQQQSQQQRSMPMAAASSVNLHRMQQQPPPATPF